MYQQYNSTIKFSCNPGHQFVFFDKLDLIRNITNESILLSDSEDQVKNSIRKIKLKDVLTMSFKCSNNEKWIFEYKMVKYKVIEYRQFLSFYF